MPTGPDSPKVTSGFSSLTSARLSCEKSMYADRGRFCREEGLGRSVASHRAARLSDATSTVQVDLRRVIVLVESQGSVRARWGPVGALVRGQIRSRTTMVKGRTVEADLLRLCGGGGLARASLSFLGHGLRGSSGEYEV